MLDAFTQLLPYVSAEIAVVAFSLTLQNLCILADSVLHAKCGNQVVCHASPEFFDAYDNIQCEIPIEHQVAAAQAMAARDNIAYAEQSGQ
eukprot:7901818-Karenia_brevis.AAC.1